MVLNKSFDFSNQSVLVAGGSSGIGNAIARLFQSLGAHVCVWGSRPSREDYQASEGSDLQGLDYRCVDLADLESIAQAELPTESLDVLIVSQGSCAWEQEREPAVFKQLMNINLNGVMATCMRCYDALKRAGGRAILINSVSGLRASSNLPAYSASKAGMKSLTESLAVNWAQDGIRVNAIAPGVVHTNLTKAALSQPGRLDANLKRIPLGRLGTTADIANVAAFLASPLSDFIVGQTVVADGGMLLS
ncbi:MAG: SDR family oxidoreductase [Pseudomonadota bacterium]